MRRQCHQRQHQAADKWRGLVELHEVDEDRQTQDTVNDGRHSCEVRDIHLDEIGPAVLGREFLEIDAAATPIGSADTSTMIII